MENKRTSLKSGKQCYCLSIHAQVRRIKSIWLIVEIEAPSSEERNVMPELDVLYYSIADTWGSANDKRSETAQYLHYHICIMHSWLILRMFWYKLRSKEAMRSATAARAALRTLTRFVHLA